MFRGGGVSSNKFYHQYQPHPLYQDKYYHEEDSPHHVKDKKTNLINWEVLEAFDMKQMQLDINYITEKVKKYLQRTIVLKSKFPEVFFWTFYNQQFIWLVAIE